MARAHLSRTASVQADCNCRDGLPARLRERTLLADVAFSIFSLTVGVVPASAVVSQTEPHQTSEAPIAMQAAICRPVAMPPAASTCMLA